MRSPLTNFFWVIISGLKGLQWKQALIALVLALLGQATIPNFRVIPVTLHSLLTADYSADPAHMRFPNLNLAILQDALGDHNPDTAINAYATLQSSLLTSVPTVTPLPGEITQTPPSATPTAPAAQPSSTVSLTLTATPTATSSPTPAETSQPLYTEAPTLLPTLTPTWVNPTQSRPTSTRPPRATATQIQAPPTQTKAPPTQAPSPTPKPPTPTKRANPYPGPTKPPYP